MTETSEISRNHFRERYHSLQLGCLVEYNSPFNASITLSDAVRIFQDDQTLSAMPVEANDAVIGVLDRETVMNLAASKLELLKSKPLSSYLKNDIRFYEARDYCERVMSDIMQEGEKKTRHLIVTEYRKFLGVIPVNTLIRHSIQLRDRSYQQAHYIQQFYLEKSDETIEGVEIGKYLQMAHHIGGDFIYLKSLSPDISMIACFDVSNKDIAASLTTSLLSSFFTMYRWTSGDGFDVTDMLTKLNRLVNEQTPLDVFVSGAFLFFFRKEQRIEAYNFGYPPVYVLVPKQDEQAPRLAAVNSNFLPLGIDDELDLTTGVLNIPYRSRLKFYLFSDGCTDLISRDGERFGDKRLEKFVFDNIRKKPADFIRDLVTTFDTFAEGAVRADDITAVAVQIR